MALPSPNFLALVGAGPVGLECALAALDAGFDVHLFERGEVGSHLMAWGHVRMFTPWRMNVGPAASRHLHQASWTPPPAEECPTGQELVDRLLQPIAELPELRDRIHAHTQVVMISRRGRAQG